VNIQLSIDDGSEGRIAKRLGFYSSLVSFIAAVGYCIAQVLQLAGVITFPADAVLIYGFSLGIAAPYVVAVTAVHYSVIPEKRIWSHVALSFAIMYAVYVNLNYVVQLATVVPSTLRGSVNETRVLDQAPHSLFWDVDALGYICMGISTFFLAVAFSGQRTQRWLRWFLIANGIMVPVISFVYFYPHFSTALLFFGAPWMITAPGSLLLLTIYFNRHKSISSK